MNLKQIIQNQNNYSLVRLWESAAEIAAVKKIVDELGDEYGLGVMASPNRIASTADANPTDIAKAMSKIKNKPFGASVKVINPNQEVEWDTGKTKKISGQLYGLHFNYEHKGKKKIVNLGLSKGSGDSKAPKDPALYEMGICVEYNKLQGMPQDAAIKKAEGDPTSYKAYQQYLSEVCGEVAKNMGNVGKSLVQTGGESFSVAADWPSKDGTPKTDIYGGKAHRISVKKKGGSQLISGKGGDAKGIFIAGKGVL